MDNYLMRVLSHGYDYLHYLIFFNKATKETRAQIPSRIMKGR